jgi:hypothetical protein
MHFLEHCKSEGVWWVIRLEIKKKKRLLSSERTEFDTEFDYHSVNIVVTLVCSYTK